MNSKLVAAVRLGMALAVSSSALPFVAMAELPVPCGGTACTGAGGPQFFYDPGLATPPVNTPTISGNTMTIEQRTDKALLNWLTFDIPRDSSVVFKQPGTDSIALNRVWDPGNNPSMILGRLSANGQIYLINRNGIVFGEGAQVDVHSLVASSLDAADNVLENGIFAPLRDGRPAFALTPRLDDEDNPVAAGSIVVEAGARLASARNGRIMLLGPEVENRGTIATPDGQAILAAGERAWIADSNDEDLRGFIVEVDAGGTARNLGDILVERGNASLVGLAVNQEGRVSARTSVSLGGSIRLMARDTVNLNQAQTFGTLNMERSGAVTIGEGSVTEVLPDYADTATAIDEQTQPASTVEAFGKTIEVREGARVTATSGRIDFVASITPAQPLTGETAGNGARIDIAAGAMLDVSGTEDVRLPMERNVLTVELRGNELKDSPVQRDGFLYTKEIKVDVREGTPIADISGALANIQRGIGERTTVGGEITLRSEDALSLASGAALDVSGGSVRYDSGLIDTTRLVSGGRIYDIADADPNLTYDAILGGYETTSAKWGMSSTYAQSTGTVEAGYIEGKDAGSMTLLGNQMAIAGTLKGETITGTRQRQLSSSVSNPLTRPADELPLGGEVTFGDASQLSATAGTANFRLPGVLFRSADETADAEGRLVLDPAMFAAGGLTRVAVYSDGRIELPEDERIVLAPGGELTLVSGSVTGSEEDGSIAPSMRIDGDISIPSGEVTLRTLQNAPVGDAVQQDARHLLAIGDGAEINVSGRWVNDTPAVAPALPVDALAIDGGSIQINSAGGVDIADGGGLLLNGGAWFDRDGDLIAGTGGDLTLGSTLSAAIPTLHFGGTAESFGLVEGGALSMTVGGISIADTDTPGISDGMWTIDPSFFQQGGFSSYNLTATHLGLSIEPGTLLEPRAMNRVMDAGMNTAPSGVPLSSFAHIETLPDYLRAPVDVSLSSRRSSGAGDSDAGLVIAAGAVINSDAGASVTLNSDNSLVVEGQVYAPAGKITLNLDSNTGVDPGLVTDKAIWLGNDAVLAAPAAVRLTPDPRGLRRGEVLDAGLVTLQAERGYVVTDPGSLIDVGGVSATLDIARSSASGTAYEAVEMAGAAGTIEVQASEGMILAGRLQARAAAVEGAAGGTLAVALDTSDPLPDIQQREFKYPTGAREIALMNDDPAALLGGLQPGDDLYADEDLAAMRSVNNGVESVAAVSLQRLQEAGLDAIDLKVRPVVSNGVALDDARIRLDAGAGLAARGRVTLDAPVIAGSGGDASIRSAYVALGPTDTALRYGDSPTSGAGTLTVQAELIDLRGDIAIQGFGAEGEAALSLESRGDVRLTGLRVPVAESAQATGSLKTVNDLRIDAAQIYPTTLSEFTLEATGAGSTVTLTSSSDRDAAIPLSAGGALNVKAPRIEVSGTVRVPHGRITLEAEDQLTLAAGSVVSVAGSATPVPYGQTQFGVDWVLPYDPALLRVLGGPGDESWSAGLPEKVIELVAEDVELDAGAQVVLDGGGDLYAWEFIPGPGGSADVLLPENTQGAFAILPTSLLSTAPLDPFIQAGGLQVGDTIEIAGGTAGLPAGEYALLPARYALLPGAFLLTPQSGLTALASSDGFTAANGLPIVAARRSSALTGSHDALWSGYAVETGAQVRQRAEYRESLASEFFAEAGPSVGQLPDDAGRLVIDAGASLSLGAAVQAAGAGRGGQVDIVADKLAVVDAGTGRTDRVELLADDLAQLNVESLLLGGRREQTGDGLRIDADAESVVIESGVELELPEIMLAAAADATGDETDGVRVTAGAALRGVGAEASTPGRYLVDGDAALLRVSSGGAAEVARSGVPAETNARIVLEEGSTLVAGASAGTGLAGGSITIDSSGNASSAADLSLGTDGALQLAASRISLGEIPAGVVTQGLALSQADLAGLDVSNLSLKSASSIDILGSLDLNVGGTLAIDAPVLRGIAAEGQLGASLRAGTLSWRSTGSSVDPEAAVEAGAQLALTAETVQLGDGAGTADLSTQGFAVTRIEAESKLVAQGEGSLQVAGELQIAAPWVTTTDGADWDIEAINAISVLTAGPDDIESPADAGLGSRLVMIGSQVTVDGRMLLPAGHVELHASGAGDEGVGVRLAEGARIDVAGVRETFLDQTLETPGGSVTLTADQGDVVVEAGSGIDASGAGGSLTVNAQGAAVIDGELRADALGDAEGSFSLTAQNLGDFSALNNALNAGGFGAARHFHLRSGDVSIGADETLRARDVAIVLDGQPSEAGGDSTGTFRLNGTIDASGDSAGQVRVYANGDLVLTDGARIDTRALGDDRQGGDVELAAATGGLSIASGAVIDVSGTREVNYERPLLDADGNRIQRTDADGNLLFDAFGFGVPLWEMESITVTDTGQVRYRMPRTALLDLDTLQPALNGAVLGAGRVELEAFQSYTDVDGVIDANDVTPVAGNPLYQDAADLMTAEADIRAALGLADDSNFHLVPGIEIQTVEDLTLAAGWDLAQWRFGTNGESGVLSLRAGGDIMLAQSLGDGVERTEVPIFGTGKDSLLGDASWSLRLAAGADLGSVDPLAVRPGAGDLTLAAGVLLRTGTGDIEARAGRDIVLGDASSVIYTSGIDAGLGTLDPVGISQYIDGVYPVLGGDVDILAGRNIEAAQTDQLVNDWLWRIGGADPNLGELPTAWNVSLINFRQGIAAFGGGNVNISAGGDVRNLSASVPTTGRQTGSSRYDSNTGISTVESDEVVVHGGDSLVIRAGGDIVGGVYYLGRGVGELTAGSSVTSRDDNALYPMLGLGDGIWRVTAGQQAAVETVFNPTLVKQAAEQGVGPPPVSSFVTYADTSALQLTALAGEVRLNQNLDRIQNHPYFSGRQVDQTDFVQYVVYPGTLQATGFRDDVVINRSLDLIAVPAGQLALYADGNVGATPNASPTVTMLDAVDAAPLHGDDPEPVRIVARRGDIGGEILNFNLAKSARLDAGGDIRNVRLDVQHLNDRDVTVLNAGGSIVHDTTRDARGVIRGSSNLIYRIAGPGRADFIAGGDIDLGTADGILTTGNTTNPFLPETGAAVTLVAGLREEPRFDDFIEEYLVAGTEYADDLAGYLEGFETDPVLSDLENFRVLPLEQQRPFLWQVFFAELRASGVEATTTGSEDYSRGYSAIEALFPEEVYEDEAAARDLSLLLSRITTLDGGGITIVVPGGSANAGVATTSALIKQPEELGIVVQGSGDVNAFVREDFAVNQSRVFTLDGGDLLMWSSFGDIDAGRGAKSSIAAPPPLVTTDENGNTVITFPPAIAGSGIRAVVTTEGVEPGDVFLFAPAGVVSAGDAGIGSAGNVTIGAVEVIGADNIDVGGVAVGVPVADTGSLAAGLTGVSNVASAATKSSEESLGGGAAKEDAGATPLSDAAFAVLDVVVLGFGEEGANGGSGTRMASPEDEEE